MRISRQTVQVFEALLIDPCAWRYGYDISNDTGLKSGTLYPILVRLSENRLLESRWEQAEPGRPPRHMYRLTHDGLRLARQHVPGKASRRRHLLSEGGVA